MNQPQTNPCVTISLLNMKGGVGKTTLAVNLSYTLSILRDRRVLLVDLDPQFNASQWLMHAEEWLEHRRSKGTVADVLLEPAKRELSVRRKKKSSTPPIKKAMWSVSTYDFGAFDFIPSELELSRAIKAPAEIPYKLEKALQEVRAQYDYVIIDCAPTDSVLTDTALMASDFVLVPMKPDRFSVLGYAQIGEALANFREKFPDPHKVQDLGVVFTMVNDDSPLERECMTEVKDQATYVFEAQISNSRSFPKAIKERAPIWATSHARNKVKIQMDALATEMQRRVDAIRSMPSSKRAK